MNIFDFNTYLYFWGSLFGLFLFILIYLKNFQIRKKMLCIGIGVAVVGVFSEYFFFQDYWNPSLIYQFGIFGGIEDLMFGFAAGGIGSAIPNIISSVKTIKNKRPKRIIAPILLFIAILAFSLSNVIGINSILSSIIALFISAIIICMMRPDLLRSMFFSAFIFGLGLIFIEGVFLTVLGEGYLQNYFLLYKKIPIIFDVILITEFIWGFFFGAVVGSLRECFSGMAYSQKDILNFKT